MVNATVSMPVELVDRLDTYAYDNRVSRAEAARSLLTRALDNLDVLPPLGGIPGQTAL